MISPFRAFFWIAFPITLMGLLTGTLNWMNPEAVHIPFGPNGESAEGLDGVLAATLSSGALGIFFGLAGAGMAWLAGRGASMAGEAIARERRKGQADDA